jgi:N utilization substance protein A
VPEIYDGTVMIRGAVREAGDRAKVAVYSRERDVDPVGACVGMKGTRVQSIIRELRGEKIDIVEWSEDPILFVTNAISPAKVQRVSIVDEAEKVMEVIVEDKQLSLAIGKKGQNVRLAAKLTGWKIDIKSEEDKRREVEAQFGELEAGAAEGAGGVEPLIADAADDTQPVQAEADDDAGSAGIDEAADSEPVAAGAAEEVASIETGEAEQAVAAEAQADDAVEKNDKKLEARTDEPSNT